MWQNMWSSSAADQQIPGLMHANQNLTSKATEQQTRQRSLTSGNPRTSAPVSNGTSIEPSVSPTSNSLNVVPTLTGPALDAAIVDSKAKFKEILEKRRAAMRSNSTSGTIIKVEGQKERKNLENLSKEEISVAAVGTLGLPQNGISNGNAINSNKNATQTSLRPTILNVSMPKLLADNCNSEISSQSTGEPSVLCASPTTLVPIESKETTESLYLQSKPMDIDVSNASQSSIVFPSSDDSTQTPNREAQRQLENSMNILRIYQLVLGDECQTSEISGDVEKTNGYITTRNQRILELQAQIEMEKHEIQESERKIILLGKQLEPVNYRINQRRAIINSLFMYNHGINPRILNDFNAMVKRGDSLLPLGNSSGSGFQNDSIEFCYRYNLEGDCKVDQCSNVHACMYCREPHTVMKCRKVDEALEKGDIKNNFYLDNVDGAFRVVIGKPDKESKMDGDVDKREQSREGLRENLSIENSTDGESETLRKMSSFSEQPSIDSRLGVTNTSAHFQTSIDQRLGTKPIPVLEGPTPATRAGLGSSIGYYEGKSEGRGSTQPPGMAVNGTKKDERPCYRWNKGVCSHNLQTCRFMHVCSICLSPDHDFTGCPRRPPGSLMPISQQSLPISTMDFYPLEPYALANGWDHVTNEGLMEPAVGPIAVVNSGKVGTISGKQRSNSSGEQRMSTSSVPTTPTSSTPVNNLDEDERLRKLRERVVMSTIRPTSSAPKFSANMITTSSKHDVDMHKDETSDFLTQQKQEAIEVVVKKEEISPSLQPFKQDTLSQDRRDSQSTSSERRLDYELPPDSRDSGYYSSRRESTPRVRDIDRNFERRGSIRPRSPEYLQPSRGYYRDDDFCIPPSSYTLDPAHARETTPAIPRGPRAISPRSRDYLERDRDCSYRDYPPRDHFRDRDSEFTRPVPPPQRNRTHDYPTREYDPVSRYSLESEFVSPRYRDNRSVRMSVPPDYDDYRGRVGDYDRPLRRESYPPVAPGPKDYYSLAKGYYPPQREDRDKFYGDRDLRDPRDSLSYDEEYRKRKYEDYPSVGEYERSPSRSYSFERDKRYRYD